MQRAIRFGSDPQSFIEEFTETTDSMSNSIIFAREYLKDLNTKREQVKYLCVEAIEPEPEPSPSP